MITGIARIWEAMRVSLGSILHGQMPGRESERSLL
jgi:hypothetical protein